MKKSYVKIHSEKTIRVTCGLQNKDVTNPDAHVADRLRISADWPVCSILIKEGQHVYPSEIVEWPTVKALAKDKILTIGEMVEEADEDTVKMKEELLLNLQEKGIEVKKEKIKSETETKVKGLADLAGSEE